MGFGGKLLFALAAWQTHVQVGEAQERGRVYKKAREVADRLGKPMLVVGGPGAGFNRNPLVQMFKLPGHDCGDVCLDIDLGACRVCGAEVTKVEASVTSIPFPDGHFGSAFISHVLEHLPTVGDAEQAVRELYRVADEVFILSPSKQSIIAWLHPGHHLWVRQTPAGVYLEPWPQS